MTSSCSGDLETGASERRLGFGTRVAKSGEDRPAALGERPDVETDWLSGQLVEPFGDLATDLDAGAAVLGGTKRRGLGRSAASQKIGSRRWSVCDVIRDACETTSRSPARIAAARTTWSASGDAAEGRATKVPLELLRHSGLRCTAYVR